MKFANTVAENNSVIGFSNELMSRKSHVIACDHILLLKQILFVLEDCVALNHAVKLYS